MVPLLTGERGIIGVGGLVLLLGIEWLWPFRAVCEPRWRRYALNFFIAGSNAVLLTGLAGGAIVGAYRALELHRVGLLHWLGVGSWWNVILTIVYLDGVTYLWHRAYHRVPVMWRLHRVHHSDRDLDVTTAGRFHLTEMVLSAGFRLGAIAVWGASLASVVIFEVLFGILNQVEHANVQIPERWDARLRWMVVTPAMHRVHHSDRIEHTNANYSTIFSWWDRLAGTYRAVADQQSLTIGLPEYTRRGDVTAGKVLAMPFGPPCGPGHDLGRSGWAADARTDRRAPSHSV